MKNRTMLVSAAVAFGLALTSAGAAQAEPTSDPGPSRPGPRIISVGIAKYRPADNTVIVPVTYRCTDRPAPGGTQHWIYVSVQAGTAPDRGWSAGLRNGPGSLVKAQCTGARITHRLVLLDGTDFVYPPAPPSTDPVRSGYVPVRATMHQTASSDWGGWYHDTGMRTSMEGSVYLRSPLG